MVPYKPEPIENLKSRFQLSIKDSYNAARVIQDMATRPGDKPKHVFDCEDGIRLIISRDFAEGKEFLHFSASVNPAAYKGGYDKKLLGKMEERFAEISGISTKPQLIAFSREGIPHWVIPFTNLN